jgi:predicted enzyme related to lactoylglutathione lyase
MGKLIARPGTRPGGDEFRRTSRSGSCEGTMRAPKNPVVHLELHTANLSRACDFYTRLFGWQAETVALRNGSYLALDLGDEVEGGVVECETERPLWLPYVEVGDIGAAVRRGRSLGASVLLEPREGPAGWRSVLASDAGAEIALWQPKDLRSEGHGDDFGVDRPS